jgi:hypothetical protein
VERLIGAIKEGRIFLLGECRGLRVEVSRYVDKKNRPSCGVHFNHLPRGMSRGSGIVHDYRANILGLSSTTALANGAGEFWVEYEIGPHTLAIGHEPCLKPSGDGPCLVGVSRERRSDRVGGIEVAGEVRQLATCLHDQQSCERRICLPRCLSRA